MRSLVEVLSVGDTLFTCRDPSSRFVIEFVEVQVSGVPHPFEHVEIRWASPQEMRNLEFAPSDRAFSLTAV